jgi:hypothetical protein
LEGRAFLGRGSGLTASAVSAAAATTTAATAIAAAAAEVTASATAAATRAAGFHRTGFVDREVTSVEGLAIEGADGRLAFSRAAHGNEGKTARALGFTVHDHVDIGDSTVLAEVFVQFAIGGLE